MGWAADYIRTLQQGETVQFRPRGNSMRGKINSGDLVTVVPVDPTTLQKGDVVLCTVHGTDYLHLIHDIQRSRFLIGNNRGGTNGWITADRIHGKCVKVRR